MTTTIGQNLKALLDEKCVNNSALARAIGLSRMAISAIITGKTKAPKHQTLCAIAAFLDVPVERITEGVPDARREPAFEPNRINSTRIPVLSRFELFNTPASEVNISAKEIIALPIADSALNPVAYVAENSCLYPQYQRGDVFVINRVLTVPESSVYYSGDDRDYPDEGTLIAVKAVVNGNGIVAVGYACYGLSGNLLVRVSEPGMNESRYAECKEYIGPVVAVYRSLA